MVWKRRDLNALAYFVVKCTAKQGTHLFCDEISLNLLLKPCFDILLKEELFAELQCPNLGLSFGCLFVDKFQPIYIYIYEFC